MITGTLVESVRTAKGPRQRIVAHIGKEPGLDEDERLGWEQIGRLLDGDEAGRACALQITEDDSKADWAQLAHGAYLLRTNCLDQDPQKLWRWYMQLTQAEAAFRCAKSDLGLRPVYHHKEERVQAHILICFLALAMWRALQSKGLDSCARQVLHELANLRSMDVVAPLRGNREARLRLVGKPEKLCADLLKKMGLKLPTRPKIIQNVVEKNG